MLRLRRHDKNALRMVMESAYVRAPGTGVPHDHKDRMRFQVMAAKVFRGELLRDPSHHRR